METHIESKKDTMPDFAQDQVWILGRGDGAKCLIITAKTDVHAIYEQIPDVKDEYCGVQTLDGLAENILETEDEIRLMLGPGAPWAWNSEMDGE